MSALLSPTSRFLLSHSIVTLVISHRTILIAATHATNSTPYCGDLCIARVTAVIWSITYRPHRGDLCHCRGELSYAKGRLEHLLNQNVRDERRRASTSNRTEQGTEGAGGARTQALEAFDRDLAAVQQQINQTVCA